MSKICRTCLQKTNTAFKTSEILGNFGQGSIRISVVLRFCIPELYLGLSSNPEICLTCKENLKMAYLFKRKCLDTENTIGNYLKDVRCTGKSIELHDVLAYIEDSGVKKSQIEPPNDINQVPKVTPKLEGEQETCNEENVQAEEVQESVPNPTNNGCIINFTDAQNLIFNHINLLNLAQNVNNPNTDTQPQLIIAQNNENASLEEKDNDNSFCKISGVFSLNSEEQADTVKNNFESTNFNEATNVPAGTEDAFEIKDEPLDIDLNDNFNYTGTDEETLDASETASLKNRCSPSLQEFIDSIPEINNPDQYVDVPDFVTINNFGFKELEEFKLQQVVQQNNLKVDEKPPEITINSTNSNNIGGEGANSEMKVVKVLATAPDVIIVNGKRMIKCGNQYKLEENLIGTTVSTENQTQLVLQSVSGISAKTMITPIRKRNRRKIKIVPVGDQPVEKKIKLDSNSIVKLPKSENRDVVVLFTNYTTDGDYINDHDYLISPYKRNKVLIEEDSQWLCMCFICNNKHEVYEHVEHMRSHGSRCLVCNSDQGTPYTLNIHSKGHRRPCRYCTQVLPVGMVKSHEEEHIAEENDILENSQRRPFSTRKGKRKANKDEKPVYFRYSSKQDADGLEKSDEPDWSPKPVIPDIKVETKFGESDNFGIVLKKRGRPRKKYAYERAAEEMDKPRTLRTRVKRWYVESDDESEIKEEVLSESKGTVSDSKEEEN